MPRPRQAAIATQLGVFAKFWEPGRVKTRLAASIGTQAARDVSRAFVATIIARNCSTADRRTVVYTPRESQKQFQELTGEAWRLHPQASGDLGKRMAAFFSSALSVRGSSVVLLGSDSPTLPADNVQQAFDALRSSEVVLGPTEDGGYYLIGIREKVPPIFNGIDWSSPRVWMQTIERLRRLDVSFATLPVWYDVDQLDDLQRLQAELHTPPFAGSDWADLKTAVDLALRG